MTPNIVVAKLYIYSLKHVHPLATEWKNVSKLCC